MFKKSVAALVLAVLSLSTIVGCQTPMLGRDVLSSESGEPGFFHQTFGSRSGVDSKAREIEKNLGI